MMSPSSAHVGKRLYRSHSRRYFVTLTQASTFLPTKHTGFTYLFAPFSNYSHSVVHVRLHHNVHHDCFSRPAGLVRCRRCSCSSRRQLERPSWPSPTSLHINGLKRLGSSFGSSFSDWLRTCLRSDTVLVPTGERLPEHQSPKRSAARNRGASPRHSS